MGLAALKKKASAPQVDEDTGAPDSAVDAGDFETSTPAADTEARKRRLGSSSGPLAALLPSSGFAPFAAAAALSAITCGARSRSHRRRSSSSR